MDMMFGGAKIYQGECCGNRFLIADCRGIIVDRESKVKFALSQIPKYCVDSALFMESSDCADIRMEIFEQDGSESDSCGNGILLITYLFDIKLGSIETKGGLVDVQGDANRLTISMKPKHISLESVDGKRAFFVRVGEPHLIYLIPDGIEKYDLIGVGMRAQDGYPGGVNVNVVQRICRGLYRIRTYERGVFNETRSCGTGSLSAYLAISYFNDISGIIYKSTKMKIQSLGGVHWVSGDDHCLWLQTPRKSCSFEVLG